MTHLRVAILISGAGSNMAALVRSMTGGHPARPVLVLSDVAGAGGLARARDLGVHAVAVDRSAHPDRPAFEAALQAAIEAAAADLVCLAGFMRVLSPDLVGRWRGRMLNVHPSLLPLHPGLDTHARALAAGDAVHGCTVHEVTEAVDQGRVLGQAHVPVLAGDTPDTLAARVIEREHVLYPAVLRRVVDGDRGPLLLPIADAIP